MKHPNIIAAAILGASIAFASIFHGCSAPRYHIHIPSDGRTFVLDTLRGDVYYLGNDYIVHRELSGKKKRIAYK